MATLNVSPAEIFLGDTATIYWVGSTGGSIKITLSAGKKYYKQTTAGSGSTTYKPTQVGKYDVVLLDDKPPRKGIAYSSFIVKTPSTPPPEPPPPPEPEPEPPPPVPTTPPPAPTLQATAGDKSATLNWSG